MCFAAGAFNTGIVFVCYVCVFARHDIYHRWGWVSFAATLALAFFSIEFFRRRVFEVFYYSHIFLFVFIVVVTAKHVGVLPSITVDYFGDISSSPGSESASQNVTTGQTRVDPFAAFDGQLAPLRSFAAFWGCILLPLVFYAVDVGERMVLALNCCGGADVVVTRAKVCYSGQQVCFHCSACGSVSQHEMLWSPDTHSIFRAAAIRVFADSMAAW